MKDHAGDANADDAQATSHEPPDSLVNRVVELVFGGGTEGLIELEEANKRQRSKCTTSEQETSKTKL